MKRFDKFYLNGFLELIEAQSSHKNGERTDNA